MQASARRLTLSALFLGLAVAAQTALSVYLPFFGQNGMRVGVSGLFTALPAILFGPWYGALVYGLSDVLGYLLKPTGAYLPLMTLTAALGGWLRGGLWRALCGRDNVKMRVVVAVVAAALLAAGLYNIFSLRADGIDAAFYSRVAAGDIDTASMHAAGRLLITRTQHAANPGESLATYLTFVTWGLVGSAAFGFALLATDWALARFLRKKEWQGRGRIMPLFLSMLAGGLTVTTLNTVILRESVYASWKLLPFAVVWVPRLIETTLSNIMYVYFAALILGLFEHQRSLRAWAWTREE